MHCRKILVEKYIVEKLVISISIYEFMLEILELFVV